MAELVGKDFIYTRASLRYVLVGSPCMGNVLELEVGCVGTYEQTFEILEGYPTLCACCFTVYGQRA